MAEPHARREQTTDRALERLADRAPSRVGVDGARRARDVSRPDAEDLAAAEQQVVLRRARRLKR